MLVNKVTTVQHMRCCLVLRFEIKFYTNQRNSSQQLLGYYSKNAPQYNLYQPELFTFTLYINWQLLKEYRQVRLSALSRTTFYGVDCQGNFVDCRGYLSLFHELFKVGI